MTHAPAPSPWDLLQSALDDLRAALPALRIAHPNDEEFLVAFEARAALIRGQVADEDEAHHVSVAMVDMLIEAGVVAEWERQN